MQTKKPSSILKILEKGIYHTCMWYTGTKTEIRYCVLSIIKFPQKVALKFTGLSALFFNR